jgi:uncharacterized protein (DUF885 family)
MSQRRFLATALLLACVAAPATSAQAPAAAQTADQMLDSLADRMIAELVAYDPTSAYFIGVPPPDNRRWPDHSLEAIAAFRAQRAALLAELQEIKPADLSQSKRFIHASMVERLESEQEVVRACRYELWDANHMSGWHMEFADVAREQPVETAEQRAEALERWSSLPTVVDQEIANARVGLQSGYSAPKSVVRRLIKQVEMIVASKPESLPYDQIAERSADATFKAAFRDVIASRVQPAFGRYRAFLNDEYLPRAREAIAITANPNGRGCYEASLRAYTTLRRPPEQVFSLGQATVNANVVRVKELAREKFGIDDLPTIVRRINETPDNRFKSEDELIQFSRAVVERARQKSAELFLQMPAQEMRVEPFHAYRRGSGGSSYYERQIDPARPAFYRIASERWESETRGGAEITAVHEGYPGHHMQISFATMTASGPIANMLGNSAYAEGWARYSEALAEEAGIYQTVYALMTRRLWPARGMVVDPGIHLMGWSREQAIAFVRESGRFAGPEADDLVDRIAVWPGQLTAYDSGALEIMALRRQAEKSLGDRFDVREFHARVLETGIVPLGALRQHIEAWIAAKQTGSP